ncbi:hypothetical protein LVD15_14025 [Fulvivirga maritima]|nr:hypothetical protein [Fulvivirga maritima]UII24440.1 hypothetical protein LVD15_14025 [Fulvivirga maritima]
MINFSLKKTSWSIRKSMSKTVDSSYMKHFDDAVTNLELNLQEERIKTVF